MKKYLLSFWVTNLLVVCALWGQGSGIPGINYQAVARDATGNVIANAPLVVKVGFSSKGNAIADQQFYSEQHSVMTDDLGLFSLVVGEGALLAGDFDAVPWASQEIWFDVEMMSPVGRFTGLKTSTKIQAVPYAFHAQSATQLVEDAPLDLDNAKNQSIRWLTSGNDLTVPGTHFVGTLDNEDFVLKTNLETRATITKEGQLQIRSGVSGPDSSPDSYPLFISGSKQGIYITVNGSRNSSNNFVTFADVDEGIHGRIEGQTLAELKARWQYKLQIALFTLEVVSLTAQAIGVAIEAAGLYAAGTGAAASLIFAFAAPGFYAAAVAATAQAVNIGVSAAALGVQWGIFESKAQEEVGVTYESGGADYAEWLVRDANERDLTFGEIVGLKGGVVSLNTADADHVMVVSKNPIVLGNAPQPDQEANYEKIAFLGQIPVRVVGKVAVGDFILPSGNNDGLGIAVNPKDMLISDYAKVVGTAWEAAEDNPLNLVKIGIGINANDLAPKVEEISNKLDNIVAFLEGKEPLRYGTTTGASTALPEASLPQEEMLTNEEFDRLIDSRADFLRSFYDDLEKQLQKQGAELPDEAGLKALFADPVKAMKALRRDPAMRSQWAKMDQLIRKGQ